MNHVFRFGFYRDVSCRFRTVMSYAVKSLFFRVFGLMTGPLQFGPCFPIVTRSTFWFLAAVAMIFNHVFAFYNILRRIYRVRTIVLSLRTINLPCRNCRYSFAPVNYCRFANSVRFSITPHFEGLGFASASTLLTVLYSTRTLSRAFS